jgi:hypothetical protein
MVSSDLTTISNDLVALRSSFTIEIASLLEAVHNLPCMSSGVETAR